MELYRRGQVARLNVAAREVRRLRGGMEASEARRDPDVRRAEAVYEAARRNSSPRERAAHVDATLDEALGPQWRDRSQRRGRGRETR